MDTSRDAAVQAVAVLEEPTRRRLYEYVVTHAEPVSRDDAATALGIPRTTAAFHLDRLTEEGLLETCYERRTGRTGPGAGRPAKLYHRSDREIEITLPERQYAVAGQLLAAAIQDAESGTITPREAANHRAHTYGEELARAASGGTAGGTGAPTTGGGSGATTAVGAGDVSGATAAGGAGDVSGATTAGRAGDVSGATTAGRAGDVRGATTAGRAGDVRGANAAGRAGDVRGATAAGGAGGGGRGAGGADGAGGAPAAGSAGGVRDQVEVLVGVLEEAGFEPRVEGDGIALVNCPFRRLAKEHPRLVCGMNLHLVAGVVAGLGVAYEAELAPAPGQCCVRLVQSTRG